MAERFMTCELCAGTVPEGSPIALCGKHLREAFEYVRTLIPTQLQRMPYACPLCSERHGTHEKFGWVCSHCAFGSPEGPSLLDNPGAPVVPVVYYIRFSDRIKIGYSANPEKRIAALPHDEVLAMEPGGRELEAARHGQFAEARIGRGEWFHMAPALVAHIRQLQADDADPWEQLAGWRDEVRQRRSKGRV